MGQLRLCACSECSTCLPLSSPRDIAAFFYPAEDGIVEAVTTLGLEKLGVEMLALATVNPLTEQAADEILGLVKRGFDEIVGAPALNVAQALLDFAGRRIGELVLGDTRILYFAEIKIYGFPAEFTEKIARLMLDWLPNDEQGAVREMLRLAVALAGRAAEKDAQRRNLAESLLEAIAKSTPMPFKNAQRSKPRRAEESVGGGGP